MSRGLVRGLYTGGLFLARPRKLELVAVEGVPTRDY